MSLLAGELALISRLHLISPKLLIDVGSCFEEYTNPLREAFPDAEIHYFDPQSGTQAIGAIDGTMRFRIFPQCPYRSTGAVNYIDVVEGESFYKKVEVNRLDTLFPGRQIDFLKIDVEGMEWDVIQGLGELRPTLIQFEYGYADELAGHPLSHFGDFFYSWGYGIYQLDWNTNWGNWIAATPQTLKKVLCTIHV